MSRKPSKEGFGTGRKFKRFARKNGMTCLIYFAHLEGEEEARRRKAGLAPKGNPYPLGRRHNAWNQSLNDFEE